MNLWELLFLKYLMHNIFFWFADLISSIKPLSRKNDIRYSQSFNSILLTLLMGHLHDGMLNSIEENMQKLKHLTQRLLYESKLNDVKLKHFRIFRVGNIRLILADTDLNSGSKTSMSCYNFILCNWNLSSIATHDIYPADKTWMLVCCQDQFFPLSSSVIFHKPSAEWKMTVIGR